MVQQARESCCISQSILPTPSHSRERKGRSIWKYTTQCFSSRAKQYMDNGDSHSNGILWCNMSESVVVGSGCRWMLSHGIVACYDHRWVCCTINLVDIFRRSTQIILVEHGYRCTDCSRTPMPSIDTSHQRQSQSMDSVLRRTLSIYWLYHESNVADNNYRYRLYYIYHARSMVTDTIYVDRDTFYNVADNACW